MDVAEVLITLFGAIVFGAGAGLFLRYYFQRHPGALGVTTPPSQPQLDKDVELERLRAAERADVRALYERLAREKLDVIKTAITMNYSRQDIAELDARLERLIGAEKLQALLTDGVMPLPQVIAELRDIDLADADVAAAAKKQLQS
jgi:hypothetical protein